MKRDYVNRRGLDLSKVVLWVYVGQRAAELMAVKVGDKKKNSAARLFKSQYQIMIQFDYGMVY